MPHVVLTQPLVDGPLAAGVYYDLSLPNFALRVGANRRVFYVRVREAGARVRVTIGQAGDPATQPGRLRVKAARQRAAELLALHGDGVVLKPADDAGADVLHADTVTVSQLVHAFHEEHAASWSPAHASNQRSHGARLVRALGPVPAKALSRHQLKTLLRKYAERAPVNANRYHAFLSKLCRWAVNEELLAANPIDQLGKVTVEESRDRELTAAEIVRLWAALDAVDANPKATPRDRALAAIWRLRLLTAQREAPLRQLQWSWVNFTDKLLDIPAGVMKGRKGKRTAHVVPLGPRALAVLQQRRDVASQLDLFVFGTRAGTSKAPGATRRAPIALPDFQGKDLRRTAATLMATHGITEFVIARVLAHKNASITGIYNRYEYVAEKRIALDTLDRVLGAILLPFQRAK
jgi:integrase